MERRLITDQDARDYLQEIFPATDFHLDRFEHGWVCTPKLTSQQIESGQGLGLARDVLDSETGIVWGYTSLGPTTIAKMHSEAIREGLPPRAQQIYPHQRRISLQKLHEDAQTIEYQMTMRSLIDPHETTIEHPIVIEKATFLAEPTDSLSAIAASYIGWMMEQNNGIWPQTAETQQ